MCKEFPSGRPEVSFFKFFFLNRRNQYATKYLSCGKYISILKYKNSNTFSSSQKQGEQESENNFFVHSFTI